MLGSLHANPLAMRSLSMNINSVFGCNTCMEVKQQWPSKAAALKMPLVWYVVVCSRGGSSEDWYSCVAQALCSWPLHVAAMPP